MFVCLLESDSDAEQRKIADNVLNFLLRITASLHDSSNANSAQCDLYVKRCIALLKTALSSDVWGDPMLSGIEIKLAWMDKVLMSSEQSNANVANLVNCVDVLELCLNHLVLKTNCSLYSIMLILKL